MTNVVLRDRVVVVVGAGSSAPGWSNGKACAVAYARAGAAIVCVDHRRERAEETADVIVGEGGRALALAADATREQDVRSAIDTAVGDLGRVDVLHSNVGVGGTAGAPDEVAPDAWEREVAQNLTTAYLGTRCVVPVMRRQGGGVITNVSSLLAVRFLRRPSVAYTASKAAVEAMTRACAVAYGGDGIRVNCLRIGFSETPLIQAPLAAAGLTADQQEAAMARSRAKVPLRGEHADPFDVAGVAVFLASDAARHVTGAIVNVDGGLESAPL